MESVESIPPPLDRWGTLRPGGGGPDPPKSRTKSTSLLTTLDLLHPHRAYCSPISGLRAPLRASQNAKPGDELTPDSLVMVWMVSEPSAE